ncbi:hypothetical protein OQA88_11042 [Cercophora sp. LCS_1]
MASVNWKSIELGKRGRAVTPSHSYNLSGQTAAETSFRHLSTKPLKLTQEDAVNFQDHAFIIGAFFNLTDFPVHPDPTDLVNNAKFAAEAQAGFDANRAGPLTIASRNSGAWLPLEAIAPDVFQGIADRYETQAPAAFLLAGTQQTAYAIAEKVGSS